MHERENMPNNVNIILKLLSMLLHYPDDILFERLPDMETVVAKMPEGENRKGFESILREMKAHTPIGLQERYTAIFDLNPDCSMNLTYHLFGDNQKRASALVRLHEIYDSAGYEAATGELPDFLPLMLEYLAVSTDARGKAVVWDYMSGLDTLVDRLEKAAPLYASVMKQVTAIRPGNTATAIGDSHAAGADADAKVGS